MTQNSKLHGPVSHPNCSSMCGIDHAPLCLRHSVTNYMTTHQVHTRISQWFVSLFFFFSCWIGFILTQGIACWTCQRATPCTSV